MRLRPVVRAVVLALVATATTKTEAFVAPEHTDDPHRALSTVEEFQRRLTDVSLGLRQTSAWMSHAQLEMLVTHLKYAPVPVMPMEHPLAGGMPMEHPLAGGMPMEHPLAGAGSMEEERDISEGDLQQMDLDGLRGELRKQLRGQLRKQLMGQLRAELRNGKQQGGDGLANGAGPPSSGGFAYNMSAGQGYPSSQGAGGWNRADEQTGENIVLKEYLRTYGPRLLEQYHLTWDTMAQPGFPPPAIVRHHTATMANAAKIAALKLMHVQLYVVSTDVQKTYWMNKLIAEGIHPPGQIMYLKTYKNFLSSVALCLAFQLHDSLSLATMLENFNNDFDNLAPKQAAIAEYQAYSTWSSLVMVKMAVWYIDLYERQLVSAGMSFDPQLDAWRTDRSSTADPAPTSANPGKSTHFATFHDPNPTLQGEGRGEGFSGTGEGTPGSHGSSGSVISGLPGPMNFPVLQQSSPLYPKPLRSQGSFGSSPSWEHVTDADDGMWMQTGTSARFHSGNMGAGMGAPHMGMGAPNPPQYPQNDETMTNLNYFISIVKAYNLVGEYQLATTGAACAAHKFHSHILPVPASAHSAGIAEQLSRWWLPYMFFEWSRLSHMVYIIQSYVVYYDFTNPAMTMYTRTARYMNPTTPGEVLHSSEPTHGRTAAELLQPGDYDGLGRLGNRTWWSDHADMLQPRDDTVGMA